MLDVYRNYYGLTGEPFRLGPDHRFSLHHESYANAKAYLEYAIFQGEGFIAITGAPGTGKTTLISEILAELDRTKVQVATLTSTQLESRDMLQMVASSFDLHPEDASKANLLVEIETFLVRKIRDGQRAILIVDEAQGLSKGALEELRLLANLQYQYQLLLQIFLVGQEQLLDLISAPEMEHLHQRLVAATTLEALTLDETIDYIEHRLSRVGWKGDPSIDENSLREIYHFSGGVPRRINLIANRLFLQGGLEGKHSFTLDDITEVIKGLVEEFLLAPEPAVSEVEMAAATAPLENGRIRSLPRDIPEEEDVSRPASEDNLALENGDVANQDLVSSTQETPAQNDTVDTEPADKKNEPIPFPGGRQAERPPDIQGTAPTEPSAAAKPQPRTATQARRHSPSMERPVPPRSASGTLTRLFKKHDVKTIVLIAFVLAGAVYLLREPADDSAAPAKPVDPIAKAVTSLQPEPVPEPVVEIQNESDTAVAEPTEETLPASKAETAPVAAPSQSAGQTENSGSNPVPPPQTKTPDRIIETGKAAAEILPGVIRKPLEASAPALAVRPSSSTKSVRFPEQATAPARDKPAVVPVRQVPHAQPKPESNSRPKPVVSPAMAEAAADKPDTSAQSPKTTKPRAHPEPSRVHEKLAQLRQEATQRLEERRQQQAGQSGPVSAPVLKPDVPPAITPPAKKKPQLTLDETIASLLEGSWSSRGKPASLLPSDSTFCNRLGNAISCKSVPQNIKTQYGLALYKVETRLSGFSPQGHFEMSYRTLVKLVKPGAADRESLVPDSKGWQISSYSMSCTLKNPGQVSCVDGKGIVREYQKTGSAK